jgi:type IV fimbrial biogenesis protein FimT
MRTYQGYTLLELMVTVAIAGVLMTFVVPSFMGMIERNNIAATSNNLLSALYYARSEAVRTETNITFTPEADGWVVTNASNVNIVDYTVENDNVTLAENINNNDVVYNSRGRANITIGDNIEISFDNIVMSRICLSLTGRPYIKAANEGNCP